ncbi:MAG: hypothetical protein ABMA13_21145 [Chthoniobacteraceae bacterium]
MKAPASFSPIEPLEARIAPATLDLTGGVLTYSDSGPTIFNSLAISINGSNQYVFSDAPNITLTGDAVGTFTGGGTSTVTGPTSAVNSIIISLGAQNDTLTVSGLADQLAVQDGGGNDTVTFSAGATSVGGNVLVFAETVDLNSLGGANIITLNTDNLSVDGAVSAANNIVISPLTANRGINLGTENAAQLSLTDTEIDRLTTPTKLVIGDTSAGNITVSAALSITTTSVLSLKSGGSVTTTGAGAITVANLAASVDASISLGGANGVDVFAAQTSNADQGLIFTDTDGFALGAVDGITGIFVPTGGITTLTAGNTVTQAAGATVVSPRLALLGAGPFTLTDVANDIATLAANTTGAVSFTDATGFDVGIAGTTLGITTVNSNVTLDALGGDVNVLNADAAATPDIDAGTGRVSVTAGAAGSDFAITINTNAGIAAGANGNAITLKADRLSIGATLNAGTKDVLLAPFEAGSAVNLGGADAAGTLGLTDAELDRITADRFTIGNSTAVVTISAAITPGAASELGLIGAAFSGGGSLTVAKLLLFVNGPTALNGANDVDQLTIFNNAATPVAFSFADADGFSIGGSGGAVSPSDFGILAFDAGAAAVTLEGAQAFEFSLSGTTPGVDHDQIAIEGTVTLNNNRLDLNAVGTVPQGAEFVILSNDGADPINGVFNHFSAGPLQEGARVPGFGPAAIITYVGGDGNDVAIKTLPPLDVAVAPGGKSATFRDVDGDLVTVKTTKGAFDGSEFLGIELGPIGAGQLNTLTLDAAFTGANITITAKPTADGGNGFVNLGFLDATGVDLGAVRIAGDLGFLKAGTVGGDPKVPGLKSLAVQSIGLLGTSTQAGSGAGRGAIIEGALPTLTVLGDFRHAELLLKGADGRLGNVGIVGSIVGNTDFGALFSAPAGIGSVKIGGDIRHSTGTFFKGSGFTSDGTIGSISVKGSITGAVSSSVIIQAMGQIAAPTKGVDLALKSLTVGGSVERLSVSVGNGASKNADASIGSINIGGDWIASGVQAGTLAGTDARTGTADDAKVAGGRDNPDLFSSIGSFTVKGQALGTTTSTGDMFGIVAERIGKAKVGGRTFAFTNGATPEAFFAAPTLDGSGAENPMFDFTIRELGSTTPDGMVTGGVNFQLSANGKTATFTDVDGDKVTVKRSAGAFVAGDFDIPAAASGGALFNELTVTAAPGNAVVNLTITATPGPEGGNGFVNVGLINSPGRDLGAVVVDGELSTIQSGDTDAARPGLGSLTAQSLGARSEVGASVQIISGEGIGKIAVKGDARIDDLGSGTGGLGKLVIGGSFGTRGPGTAITSIGSIKIGGSILAGTKITASETIGSISVGGDIIGDGINGDVVIEVRANGPAPARGLDFAIKSIAVKGSIERTSILAGTANADASIGRLTVGRAWLASSVLAGVTEGADGFRGTADDTKVTGASVRDDAARFSTISSIVIKGQALGSTTAGDSFGIVAEQIGKAKVGARTFVFDKGERDAADDFAAAPTGPGPAPDNAASDFFIREIAV